MSPDPHCPSPFVLDRLSAGELAGPERARVMLHVANCPACDRALERCEIERSEFAPDPRLLALLADAGDRGEVADRAGVAAPRPAHLMGAPTATDGRGWRSRWAVAALPALLCAAGLALVLRGRGDHDAPDLGRRASSKGAAGPRLLVQRDGELLELADGDLVHPGDRLQVAIELTAPRLVAVYSRDGAGQVSRYAPIDAHMVPVAPGAEAVLPNSTVLDDVLGREVIAVFACAQPVDDEVLRASVEAGQPPRCEVSRTVLRKVAR